MPSTKHRQQIVGKARKIIVKIGTAVLTGDDGKLDTRIIAAICRQISALIDAGRQVIVVSSGAVGAGVGLLELPERPKDLPMIQAAAAVGQGLLMKFFERNFARYGRHAAQILITRSDFEDRRRYVNIQNTLAALHHVNAVPIINENDTVAVDELRFGENDLIAALTANLVQADLLTILSTVDGLQKQNEIVDFVPEMTDQTFALAQTTKSTFGMGGMPAKLQAIYVATQAGVDVILANGRKRDILKRVILNGEQLGTVFAGRPNRLRGRRSWIALAVRPAGTITVDSGAARALIKGGKSLLPGGVTEVTGRFERNAVVSVVDQSQHELARGQVNYASAELEKIMGRRTAEITDILGRTDKTDDEVIHRNNLIITAG